MGMLTFNMNQKHLLTKLKKFSITKKFWGNRLEWKLTKFRIKILKNGKANSTTYSSKDLKLAHLKMSL